MLAAIKKQEPGEARRRVKQARDRREGASVPAPSTPESGSVESVRATRAQTNEKYRALLEAQLTPEQYQELPGAGKMAIKARADTKPGAEAASDSRLNSNRPAGRAPAGRGAAAPSGGERPNPADIPSANPASPPRAVD